MELNIMLKKQEWQVLITLYHSLYLQLISYQQRRFIAVI